VAPMAISAGRRVIGWSAVAVTVAILVTSAVSLDDLGQMSNMLWLLWIAGTSVALARIPAEEHATVEVALA